MLQFHNVIKRAEKSFDASQVGNNYDINYHFRKVRKMIATGKGAERPVDDYLLSRYACYLIAQNGDSSKVIIADAQAYFNIQTLWAADTHYMVGSKVRKAIEEIGGAMPEDLPPEGEHIKKLEKRLSKKQLNKKHNKQIG